jgi:two-component sensor histidine kinase
MATDLSSLLSNKLALAMIEASTAPLVLLDSALNVVAASASFCRVFDIDSEDLAGRPFLDLGSGEWNLPQLTSLFSVTVAGAAEVDAYEIDLKRPGQPDRRLVLNAKRLAFDDAVSLLLTVSDVTDARVAERLKDDMLKEKAVLLQEVQHRVANSLQIIASVLLQSARKVQSEEIRTHLRDAHHRVMSIATVQQQLAASRVGNVELRPYFTQLCASLGASMIRDHDQQSIVVTGDASLVTADVSVSLGLIVTELVINALKHAFPTNQAGLIKVDYRAHGPNWTLRVDDNGVGMPAITTPAKAGLGTSIVEALARQLQARVDVEDARPGVTVSIVHTQIAAVEDEVAERAV